MTQAQTLKAVRLIHLYTGVFLAPAILFFAITGGLQMFGLHETSRGSTYQPPVWLTHLSQLHKKGTLYFPPARPKAPKADAPKADGPKFDGPKLDGPKLDAPKAAAPAPVEDKRPNPLPIKIFFAITALGLVTSTLSGIVMAWKYARRKWVVLAVLGAGVAIPLLLLLI
jgi:hypothetical protein